MYSYSDCSAMYGENPEKRCVGCGDSLPPRHRVWCTSECMRLWRVNHVGQAAREYALWCDTLRPRKRRVGRWRHSSPLCARCGIGGWHFEVNHRTPVMGRHAEVSCLHHQEGLEVLCHTCHVDETNRQFRRGRYRLAA